MPDPCVENMKNRAAKKVEIMAPVGNRAMLEAAIHNGADSVYVGMPGFNARGRADELSISELGEFINVAHVYGVKFYIAFNVLIFDDELRDALDLFLKINRIVPDAWIVQDPGLALLMKALAPDVNLHASTQMTIVNDQDILFYLDIGIKRFTLARELSIKEIALIASRTKVELEAFIHGSLCIAYSGQCFTSSGFGGRSANRGECAQSCRHDYDLFADGRKVPTGGNYLVSPRDLVGADQALQLAEIGVSALKIEGRLKSPEYVAAAVRLYRSLVDENKTRDHPGLFSSAQLTFNRDAKAGWLNGVNHNELVDSRVNSHTGMYLGSVQSVMPGRLIVVELETGVTTNKIINEIVNKGDGIAVNADHETCGSHVYEVNIYVKNKSTLAELSLANDFSYSKMKQGMPVYLTSSPMIQRELTKSFTDKSRLKHVPVEITFTGKIGEKICLTLHDFSNGNDQEILHEVKVYSGSPLEKSQKQSTNVELIKNELAALSASPYNAKNIHLDIDLDGFFPNKVIKELRQRATAELTLARTRLQKSVFGSDADQDVDQRDEEAIVTAIKKYSNIFIKSIPDLIENIGENTAENKNEKCKLHALVRNPAQLEAVLNLESSMINTVYLDFVYGHEFTDAVKKIQDRGLRAGIATARIYKPGQNEMRQIHQMVLLNSDAILVRSATALQYLSILGENNTAQLVGDFSLNITNRASSQYFLNKGLHRITASYDLVSDQGREQNIERVLGFLAFSSANLVEVNMSYYLPSFYMEYCLFSKHLGNGLNSPDCGFPCKDHTLFLKDRKSETHPVIADRNCRNTMFNGRQKNLLGYMDKHVSNLLNRGVKNFRVELSPDNRQLQNDLDMIYRIYKLIK
jgi:putative protease